MRPKGPRGLTPEEQALWNKVKQRANPMHPDQPRPGQAPVFRARTPAPDATPIPAFRIGENHTATALPHNLGPTISDRLARQPVQMDRKNYTKLKRGKLQPEARIDLHGMTVAQAHPVLNRFILDAYAKGRRLVLVITGKGKDKEDRGPIPVRRGVLKHQVPEWLTIPPLGQVVLQVSQAHLKHGGSGAYYVYLRRAR